MNTPRPESPIAMTSASSSRSSASRDGIGSPPSPLCAGDVLVAKPTAPACIASRTIDCIASISAPVAARLAASLPMT